MVQWTINEYIINKEKPHHNPTTTAFSSKNYKKKGLKGYTF
jgi:hypothetical protein